MITYAAGRRAGHSPPGQPPGGSLRDAVRDADRALVLLHGLAGAAAGRAGTRRVPVRALLATAGLECDESVLAGKSVSAEKSAGRVAAGTPLAELSSCALMGTVVRAGSGTGVVVATGGDAEFGRIAVGLRQRQPETEFQAGLRRFSMLLVQVAGVLTGAIFIINVALHKPVTDALLFSLSIAAGISPQLLPAVVSTSLAAGSRQLARSKVLVKRLVCIEDLGDIDVLFTDKTGTLTEGSVRFMRSAGPGGRREFSGHRDVELPGRSS
jgi:P-type Mg2+ transporter